MDSQPTSSPANNFILKVALWDLVILAAAAGTAWFAEMRTLAGFGQALVWAGGAGAIIGGMAALAQWLLTRVVPGSGTARADRHGLVPAVGGALSSGDATLQTMVIIAGSGLFWAIAGRLLLSLSR